MVIDSDVVAPINVETEGLTATDEIICVGVGRTEDIDTAYTILHQSAGTGLEKGSSSLFNFINDSTEIPFSAKDIEVEAFEDEEMLLKRLREILKTEPNAAPTIGESSGLRGDLVGYSSKTFDVPHLHTRGLVSGIQLPRIEETIDLKRVVGYNFQLSQVDPSGFKRDYLKGFGEHLDAPVDSSMYVDQLEETINDHGYDAEDVKEFAREEGLDLPTKEDQSLSGVWNLFTEKAPSCPPHVADAVELDPVDNSKDIPKRYDDGDIESVIEHCLTDLIRIEVIGVICRDLVPAEF